MSAPIQTVLALGVVVVAAALLLFFSFRKKKNAGCGSEGCHAVSPELKKLQARLKR
jgi:LPXTG-motif cell wall-anchored protein